MIALRPAQGKEEKVNIIAKSVGTMIAMKVLSEIGGRVNKIILCGIPSVSNERKKLFTASLSDFNPGNIIVFQNTKDPLASFIEVKDFMKGVNPKIKVVEKPRVDHHYPYFVEFNEFLN